jgi:hypothetical protein
MLFEELREVEYVVITCQSRDFTDPPVAVAQKICGAVHPRPYQVFDR